MDPGKIHDLLKQSVSRLFVGVDSVEEEVQKLEDNLRSIRQLLDFAEPRQVKNVALKLWSDKLKGLSEEMKDVLDEWNTSKLKSAIDEQWQVSQNPPVKEGQKPFRFWEKPNKKSLSHSISHKIKELSLALDELLKDKPAFGSIHLNAKEELIQRPPTTPFIDVSDVVGRGETVDNLVRDLLDMEGRIPCVISLVGMVGIGKSTVAQVAYNDADVRAHFDISVWVCVSRPFDNFRVAREIVEAIGYPTTNTFELQSLLQKIYDLVNGMKFLLVLDDVWNLDLGEWEPFRLALKAGAHGSKILVTTRNMEVAYSMGSAIVTNLNVLSEDDCRLLLSRRAFNNKDSQQLQELEDIAQKMAKKCKGLPLYAKVLGSFMCSKRIETPQYHLFRNLWDYEEVNEALFAPLLLQYYDFPSMVRDCLLYCAVFPKDKLILKKDLIQLWMAQDYLKENGNMEIIGQKYFENLVMHSFFQDFEKDEDDGTIIGCKMHDLVHEFVVSQTRKKEFFQMVVDSNKSEIAPLHSTRHLSLTFARQAQFPKSLYDAKELRTLLCLNSRHAGINSVLPNLCRHLTCLRALNLSDSSIEKVPNEIENLEYLRFLDLSSNYEIEELPEMLCNLCNLQTLNVSRCYMLEKLPKGMGKLINLRHLVLEGTNFMKMFPKGIGRLSSLRTLTKFIRSGNDESEGCGLEELGNMYHLEGALEINGLGNVVDVDEAKDAQLKKKERLCCLYLGFDREGKENRRRESDEYVLNALEPGPDVRVLQIHLYQATTMFPNWLMSLNALEVLKLTKCSNLQHLPPLSRFLFLKSLEILNAHSLKKVGVEFLGIEYINKDEEVDFFPNLISLIFSGLKQLEEWNGIGGMGEGEGVSIMPRLQILIIRDCPKLKALPNFLKEIPIKELRIEYCSQISNWEMLLTSLKNLKVLVLKQCKKLEHFPPFGKLRVLESLSLWNLGSVKSVGPEFLGIESDSKDSFPNLNFLEFWSFGEWEEWVGIGGMAEEEKIVEVMPCLRSLIIYNCPKLKSLPHFLQNSPLEELRISGSPILKQTCQGGDWPKSSHIPNIKIND